jgi:hypothetical protein
MPGMPEFKLIPAHAGISHSNSAPPCAGLFHIKKLFSRRKVNFFLTNYLHCALLNFILIILSCTESGDLCQCKIAESTGIEILF